MDCRHFLFEIIDEDSEYCGEEFLVGAKDYHSAREIVNEYFPDIKVRFWHEVSDYEAEMSGLDEY